MTDRYDDGNERSLKIELLMRQKIPVTDICGNTGRVWGF